MTTIIATVAITLFVSLVLFVLLPLVAFLGYREYQRHQQAVATAFVESNNASFFSGAFLATGLLFAIFGEKVFFNSTTPVNNTAETTNCTDFTTVEAKTADTGTEAQ